MESLDINSFQDLMILLSKMAKPFLFIGILYIVGGLLAIHRSNQDAEDV